MNLKTDNDNALIDAQAIAGRLGRELDDLRAAVITIADVTDETCRLNQLALLADSLIRTKCRMSDNWAHHAENFNRARGIAGLANEIEALRAENERLRDALQEILDHPAPSAVAYVARDALGRTKE